MRTILAQSATPTPDPGVDVDPSARITEGTEDVLRSVTEQIPQILLAIVVVVLFVLLGRFVAMLVRKALSSTTDRSESFLDVMSRLARGAVLFVGILIALVIAVPSVDLAAVIGGLGISSVAIGFAFKDILQNTLAGLLLLFRQPFEIGDQIEVAGHTGIVEAITIRETRLKTYDGQRILIPNSDVYSSSVRVQTAYDVVRSVVAVGVDYDADLERAKQVALEAVQGVEGVAADPVPQTLYTQLGTSTIDFDVRYWSSSRQADIRTVQDRVVVALTNALNEAGIAMPADVIELDARASFSDAVTRSREDRTA
ncbi:MAG: mechanosensitive ion channel family protein [Actinomycetota bacterium]